MTKEIDVLTELPNIGKTLADRLHQVGIDTPDQLKQDGAENTFIKIQTVDKDACLSMLCALEGAVQGIRWHRLSSTRKAELKIFHQNIKRNKF
ncbi:TfoX/Sxy family protein [Saccharicrinis sp. FJH54]|uniref:TfoX/Sxy family protein n=1 Tax=Saccharicrinis sp. FJH54 TaxID=3344665 RepID=UPI0035D44381